MSSISFWEQVKEDFSIVWERDPAIHSKLELFTNYPGVWSLFWYRIAHRLYTRGWRLLARMIMGLIDASRGTVTVDGKPVADERGSEAFRRKIHGKFVEIHGSKDVFGTFGFLLKPHRDFHQHLGLFTVVHRPVFTRGNGNHAMVGLLEHVAGTLAARETNCAAGKKDDQECSDHEDVSSLHATSGGRG